MITIKSSPATSHATSIDLFQANESSLIHVKNFMDTNIKDQHRNFYSIGQSTEQQKTNKLKKIFLKAKINKIRDIFAEKLMRRIDSDDPIMLKIWQEEINNQSPSIEGFVYPEELQYILDVLHIITSPLLIILTTFLGFLPDFSEQYSSNFVVIILNIFCFIVAALRFFIKCTNVTFSEGQYKRTLKQIITAYFKSNKLVFDAVLIILQAMCLILARNMVIAGILFFYLNFMMIFSGSDTIKIQAAYIQNKRTALLWSLVKIVFFNVFFAHFMGTIILAMANFNQTNNWMVRAGIQDDAWYLKYIYAYYWGTTIMMTVGFGDLLPAQHNPAQVFVTSFLQMFSCIVLGYNISSIGNIVSKLRDAQQTVNKKIVIFQRMMRKDRQKKANIDPLLEKRISNYLRQLRMDKDNLYFIERDGLLEQLPQNLRKSYYKEANKRIFPSVIFFRRLNQKTLEILAEKFKSKYYNPGEHLNQTKNILILENGKIGLGYKKKGSTQNGLIADIASVQQCQQTLLLNGRSFLTFLPEKRYQLFSQQSSIIWSISKQQFIQTLNLSIIDSQYYYSILHKHPVDQNQWQFIVCPRCSTSQSTRYHSTFICPKVSYLPIRSMASHFYMANSGTQDQQRIKFKRNRFSLSKMNALSWKDGFPNDYQKIQVKNKNKNIKKTVIIKQVNQHYISLIERSTVPLPKMPEFSLPNQQIIQYKQNQSSINQKMLKRLIKQVLFEHETGYEQGFWNLECDQVYDYQFYFPQDNSNRLCMTPIYIHPRQFYKYDEDMYKNGKNFLQKY